MGKVYTIISGKGGTGKTTSTINLGASLNHLGEDVAIVDGNLTTPNIGIHLGAPIVPTTINHVLSGQAKIEDATYEHESGTKVIPASLSLKETQKVNYKKFPEIAQKLKKLSNHVLIDSAAGLGEEAQSAISAADEIIVITNPEMSAVTDALKTVKLSEEMHKPIKGVIITRYRGKRHDMSIQNIKDMLEHSIMGVIPEDEAVKHSQAIKNAVVYTRPKSNAARAYIDASRKILGNSWTNYQPPIRLGFLSRLFGRRI